MERAALRIGKRFETLLHFVAEGLVLRGGNDAARLAALDVEENTGVVAAFAPYFGFGPIHLHLGEWRDLFRHFVHDEEAFAREPLIDSKPAVQALCAVVGDDEEDGLSAEHVYDGTDLLVEPEVVVGDYAFQIVAGLVVNVPGVKGIPETVVDAVETDVHVMKIVPLFFGQQPADNFPVLAAHREDLFAKPAFVVGAETGNVHGVVADKSANLVANLRRVGELVLHGIGREEAADADAFDGARGIARRQTHDNRAFAVGGEVIPDGRLGDGAGVHETEAAVSAVGAIAEAVHAERTRILAGGHAHPGRNGDWRDNALEAPPGAHAHQTAKILQAGVAEDDVGGGAVEAENADFRMRNAGHGVRPSRLRFRCATSSTYPGRPGMPTALFRPRAAGFVTTRRACIIDVRTEFSQSLREK